MRRHRPDLPVTLVAIALIAAFAVFEDRVILRGWDQQSRDALENGGDAILVLGVAIIFLVVAPAVVAGAELLLESWRKRREK